MRFLAIILKYRSSISALVVVTLQVTVYVLPALPPVIRTVLTPWPVLVTLDTNVNGAGSPVMVLVRHTAVCNVSLDTQSDQSMV